MLRARWICTLLLAAHALAARAGESDVADESRLKVALIYNFIQFVEWPPAAFNAPDAPFMVCVAGGDPFGAALLAMQKRSYRGHPIVIGRPGSVEEARRCHILYTDNARAALFGRELAKALGDAPVLTVSSQPDAVDHGVAIGFVQQADRIRWNMNLQTLRRSQLKVSAKLIEISIAVVGEASK